MRKLLPAVYFWGLAAPLAYFGGWALVAVSLAALGFAVGIYFFDSGQLVFQKRVDDLDMRLKRVENANRVGR